MALDDGADCGAVNMELATYLVDSETRAIGSYYFKFFGWSESSLGLFGSWLGRGTVNDRVGHVL
jgi:hypothetical protein